MIAREKGIASVTYNPDTVSLERTTDIIEKLDYQALSGDYREKLNANRIIGFLIVIMAIY